MGRRILEIGIGILLLATAFGLAFFFQQTWQQGVERETLPVPRAEIAPYVILTAEMFETKEVPRALITGYALTINELVGKISTSKIPAGLPVPLAQVSAPADFRLADPNMEVISVPITPTSSVGGKVQVGDLVNVYRLAPPGRDVDNEGVESFAPASVTLVARNIRVVAVLGVNGNDAQVAGGSGDVAAQILVLAVTPEEADLILKVVAESKQNIMLWFSLAPLE